MFEHCRYSLFPPCDSFELGSASSSQLSTKIIPHPHLVTKTSMKLELKGKQTRQVRFHKDPVHALGCSTVQSAQMISCRRPLARVPCQLSVHAIYDRISKWDTVVTPGRDFCNSRNLLHTVLIPRLEL